MSHHISPSQTACIKLLIKAGKRGLHIDDVNQRTLEGLLDRRLVRLDGERVVLDVPTKTQKVGIATRTTVDWEAWSLRSQTPHGSSAAGDAGQ